MSEPLRALRLLVGVFLLLLISCTNEKAPAPSLNASPTSLAPPSSRAAFRVTIYEAQSWSHQGDPEFRLVVVPPVGFRVEQVILKKKGSRDVDRQLAVEALRGDACYMVRPPIVGSAFQTQKAVVIPRATVSEGGPRMDKLYKIEAILIGPTGRVVADVKMTGLCSIITE
ncbi:MAG: hypothetical protein ABR548_13195 [Actinomycetota bacterium]